jgi:sortase (surface protein transpeptidase)
MGLLTVGLTACAAGGPPATVPADPTPATGAPAVATAGTTVADFPVRSWRRLPPSPPVRVEIPAIGVSSSLVRLGLNPDGTMQVPSDFRLAGWYTGGPQPGQLGPAVIAGHVDSRTGPAVFYRLGELRAGDRVRVVRADRRVVEFVVESLASYPKQALPAEQLYGATTAPALRLVTCAGAFDRSRRSYRENLVVTAGLAGVPGQGRGREADR